MYFIHLIKILFFSIVFSRTINDGIQLNDIEECENIVQDANHNEIKYLKDGNNLRKILKKYHENVFQLYIIIFRSVDERLSGLSKISSFG